MFFQKLSKNLKLRCFSGFASCGTKNNIELERVLVPVKKIIPLCLATKKTIEAFSNEANFYVQMSWEIFKSTQMVKRNKLFFWCFFVKIGPIFDELWEVSFYSLSTVFEVLARNSVDKFIDAFHFRNYGCHVNISTSTVFPETNTVKGAERRCEVKRRQLLFCGFSVVGFSKEC